jgi:hypothetical protein
LPVSVYMTMRLAFDDRQHRLAVSLHRPGAGQIVGSDEDRGDAVAAASRALGFVLIVLRRQRLDPKLAGAEAAGKVA